MEEENQQPTDQAVEPEKEKPATTIEEVAKRHKVEEQVNQFTAQPNQSTQETQQTYQPESSFPDPVYDPDGWKRYQQNQMQSNQHLQGTLRDLVGKVGKLEEGLRQERLNVEVNKAVKRVNEKLNVEPTYVEIALEKRYRDDPAFRRIWDKRTDNPKALDEALEVITGELEGVFQVRQDPQLTENVRAAKKSQQTLMRTPGVKSVEEEAMKMSDPEFERWWYQNK